MKKEIFELMKLSFSSHKAVIAAFGKEFIKSNTLPLQLHHNIVNAFRLNL